jgi:NAD(P)-dependent dehydrogenase (short-subunit alcohol dehydrogenase family)
MAGMFAGKVALVTGASSGIGRAVALRLGADGATVALVARGAAALEEVAAAIARAGGRARAYPADVQEPDAAPRVVGAVAEAFGRLDVLVCAAGLSTPGDIRRVPDAILEQAVRTKLLGYVRFAREAAPRMGRGGVMVFIAGGAGKQPQPASVVNALSNAGILAFTQAFAAALAPEGIRVVAVNPGSVATPVLERQIAVVMAEEGLDREAALAAIRRRQPLGRIAEPEEIADLVAYLASDAAALLTGTSLDVGGAGRAL